MHLGFPIKIVEAYKSLYGKIWRLLGVFVCMILTAAVAAIVRAVLVILLIAGFTMVFSPNSGAGGRTFAMFIGFGMFLIIGVSAMVVWVRYALAIACCVVEDLGVRKSLKRSVALSKGSRFRTFLINIVFLIAGVLLGAALGGLAVIAQPEVKRQAAIAPDNPQQMYETVAAQEMVFRRELLLGRLREHGALCLEVAPHQLSASLLNQYLSVKERNLI